MANIELLDRVIAHIEANPEAWDQRQWAIQMPCRTAFCLAGWTVHIAHPDAQPEWSDVTHEAFGVTIPGDLMPYWSYFNLASQDLDLTTGQASMLFDELRTLAEIKKIRDLVAADPMWRAYCQVG